MSGQQEHCGIVRGGKGKLRRLVVRRVREELAAEHLSLLQSAGLVQRLVIRLRMYRELRRRLEAEAPRDALYVRRGYGS